MAITIFQNSRAGLSEAVQELLHQMKVNGIHVATLDAKTDAAAFSSDFAEIMTGKWKHGDTFQLPDGYVQHQIPKPRRKRTKRGGQSK